MEEGFRSEKSEQPMCHQKESNARRTKYVRTNVIFAIKLD